MKSGSNSKNQIKWMDSFTKTLLAVMFVILIFIFVSGKYMEEHKMKASGTDDKVNSMASTKHRPFIELPGDAEIGRAHV